MRYVMVGACFGVLLALTFGSLAQAQQTGGKPVSLFEKMPAGLSEKEQKDYINSICANPPLSAAPVPQEYINLCGHRTAPTVIPTNLTPDAQRGPIITQDAGHQATGLGTSSVAGIATLTSFGALVYPGTDFPADLEVLPTDLQNVYQLTTAGLNSRYNSAGANTALPTVAPPAGGGWSDMAVDPTTGTVYAASVVCGTSSALYTVNLTTGASALIGNITNSTCLVGLAADNLGNLYGHDIVNDSLIAINKLTGAGTVVGLLGFNANFGQSMDCDPGSGICYLFAFNATTSLPELRSVNLGTGATTLIGTIGSTSPGAGVQISGGVFATIGVCAIDADCNDGNPCNGVETCQAPNCVPGTPVVCNDGLFCTTDSCNPANGQCQTVPNTCSDGDGCTIDACNENTDTCSHVAAGATHVCSSGSVVIGAGNAVPYPSTITVSGLGTTATLCSIELNGMSHTFPDDIDVMLAGPSGGTQNRTIMSDVGGGTDIVNASFTLKDAAATLLPDAGPLVSGTFKPTNIGAADTFPAPAPTPTGLAPLSPAFDNINPNGNWSLYIVDDSAGDTGTLSGWCLNIVVAGCSQNSDCSDGNPCNGIEVCSGGTCGPGTPVNCDDSDICTTDACVPADGSCTHTAVVCNDNNVCTDDTCVSPTQGCTFTNNTAACSDNNPCTAGDICSGGACQPGTPNACDDANSCTSDACDALIGCYHSAAPNGPCDDGNPCTDSDSCNLPCTGNYSENFDGVVAPALPPGWTTALVMGQAGDIAWRTAASTDTPPNGGNTDDPAHVTDKVLDMPPLPAGATQLSFNKSYVTEDTPPNYYDGAVLEIKIGTGAFQDILAAGGSFVTGGYVGAISTGFSSPIAGRQAWSGSAAAFSATTVNLPASSAGQNTIIRWRMASDSSVAATGFTIDTVTVTTCASSCTGSPVGSPGEVTGDTFAFDKQTFSWSPTVFASRYDVVRGGAAGLPVGPGGGDETCFSDVIGTSLVDGVTPLPGASNWYVVRGDNACAAPGTYGNDSSGNPRITTTCP